MANANIASGLTPIDQNGVAWSGQFHLYSVPASQGTAIFRGDPIIPLGGVDAYGVPLAGLATAGNSNYLIGSMVSVVNGPAGGGASAQNALTRDLPIYHQASTVGYILVADDYNQRFVIQEDSVGGAMAAASVGWSNANLVAGTGSTTTGLSGWQLQSSSLNASNTRQLRVLELLRGPDNAVGVNAKWVVMINLHSRANLTGI